MHLLSLQTSSPSFSFFAIHHIRIYKSQLTTAHSPKTFSFQVTPGWSAALEVLRCLKPSTRLKKILKSKNTHKQRDKQKSLEERELVWLGFQWEKGRNRVASSEGIFGVYSKESPVLILNPTLTGSLTLWFLEKTRTSFETWHLPSQNSPASHTEA